MNDLSWVMWAVGAIALLLVAALCGVLIIRSANRRRRAHARAQGSRSHPFPTEAAPSLSSPENLGHKDIVVIGGVTYEVRGVIMLDEGGYRWKEFWLDAPSSKVWLSVERETMLEVIQWTEVGFDQEPGKKKLKFGGVEYSLRESGVAGYEALGTTDLRGRGTVEYCDYVGPNDARLSFERFDNGEWEAAEGFVLPEGLYEIYRRGTTL